jgi:hypothetical protein
MAIEERIPWKSGDFRRILFTRILCMSQCGIFLLLPSAEKSPKKKASLVVQGIFLAHTKNWANKEFNFYVLLFMINLLLTQKWVDMLFL